LAARERRKYMPLELHYFIAHRCDSANVLPQLKHLEWIRKERKA
jgi:hypothetical protein